MSPTKMVQTNANTASNVSTPRCQTSRLATGLRWKPAPMLELKNGVQLCSTVFGLSTVFRLPFGNLRNPGQIAVREVAAGQTQRKSNHRPPTQCRLESSRRQPI